MTQGRIDLAVHGCERREAADSIILEIFRTSLVYRLFSSDGTPMREPSSHVSVAAADAEEKCGRPLPGCTHGCQTRPVRWAAGSSAVTPPAGY